MSSSTRAFPMRPLSVGGIAVLTLLLVALVATIIYVGSRQTVVPTIPLAQNGVVVFVAADGRITSLDPVTGRTTPIGGAQDSAPVVSPDGRRYAFVHGTTIGVADIDGSNARIVADVGTTALDRIRWSPDGERLVVARAGSSYARPDLGLIGTLAIIDVASRTVTGIDVPVDVTEHYAWRPGHDAILFSGKETVDDVARFGLFTVNVDGTGLRALAPTTTSDTDWMEPVLSPDGTMLAYTRWQDGDDEGRVHLVDLDTLEDRRVEFDGTEGATEFVKAFSPDGQTLLLQRFLPNTPDGQDGGFRAAVASLDGSGDVTLLGPTFPTGTGAFLAEYAPDGSQIFLDYDADGSTWLLDTVAKTATKVDWPVAGPVSWQAVP